MSGSSKSGGRARYRETYRRVLVDMHIPDWDPAFLSEYEPKALAAAFEAARVSAVMMYCKSHTGLCNWPTERGRAHANLRGRDVVGELLAELERLGMGTCAYYSVVYDNWAAEQHPDWAHVPVQSLEGRDYHFISPRYGTCCPNNPEYLAYELPIIDELLGGYRFDSIFFDMTFWPAICVCPHCRDRYRAEGGGELPERVDWTDPSWCRFQAAREAWISEFIALLVQRSKAAQPGITVYNNAAAALGDWTLGQPVSAYGLVDFVGGDLYGDPYEQLLVCKLLLHATPSRPGEFMTSRCVNLGDHVTLVSEAAMEKKAFAATALSSAFLFIDAIDPIGTLNSGVYDRIGRIFEKTAPYEAFLGGEPIEDVAVYFSVDSQMDLAQNATPLARIDGPQTGYPHLRALKGACRALQRAHIPFGVITRAQLDSLDRYRVVILPNVLRMDAEEETALRAFVAAGGRLYASRYTSLTTTGGARLADFALADVFGCRFDSEETGIVIYSRLRDVAARAAVEPQEHLLHHVVYRPPGAGVPRLSSQAEGAALATLSLPYAHPAFGDSRDHKWASIHSLPPWEDLPNPTIVSNRFGSGAAVYSAADIEAQEEDAPTRLFTHLVRELVEDQVSFRVDTHPAVWVNAFDQPAAGRVVVTLLNNQAEEPPLPVGARLSLKAPPRSRFTAATLAPDGRPLDHAIDDDGSLRVTLPPFSTFALVVAPYRPMAEVGG